MGCLGDKNKKSNISQTEKRHSLSMYTKHDRILSFFNKILIRSFWSHKIAEKKDLDRYIYYLYESYRDFEVNSLVLR